MPCWPDLWQELKNSLQTIGWSGAALSYVSLAILLIWAPKVRKRWMLIASRVVGAAALLPILIASPAIILGVALASGDPPPQHHTFRSPSGQEATLSYQAGFLGRDYTEITLKRTGCCRHTSVFWHAGPSEFDDPAVEWLDDRHLSVTYHTRAGDPQHCEERAGDVSIACVSMQWPKQ
jgi:hypothetical protein